MNKPLYLLCFALMMVPAAQVAAESKSVAPVSGRILSTDANQSEIPSNSRLIAASNLAKSAPSRSLSKNGATISTGGKHYSYANASAAIVPGEGVTLTKVYKFSKNGVPAFADAAPRDAAFEVLTYGCFACNVNSTVDWYTTKLYPDSYAQNIQAAAQTYAVDPALVRAVIHAESGFNPTARSGVGAMGLMQLMPDTAKDMGVHNAYEAAQNILGGVKYLAYLLETFKGDITLATAAYNAGPNNVTKYQGIPPFAETQAYVKRVKILLDRYRTQI